MKIISLFISLLFFTNSIFALDCETSKEAISAAAQIRGLRIKQTVPCFIHDREEVKKFITTTINEQLPLEKLKNEEFLYQSIGLIPKNFSYVSGITELYLSQIGGYYDPSKNHYVMAGWLPEMMQPTIAVHELTHALQDQYYDLEKFMDHKVDNSDLLLARSAIAEGDATAVMTDYNLELAGQPPLREQKDVQAIMMQSVMGMAMMMGDKPIPESLKSILIFPYTSGLRFAHEMLKLGGYQKLDEVYRNPPNSTKEILHPEAYLNPVKNFRSISDEEVLGADKSEILYRDTMGEFGINAIIGNFTTDKAIVAEIGAGWAGDRVIIVRGATTERKLYWKTLWETEKDANDFFVAFDAVLKKIPGSVLKLKLLGKGVLVG